MQADNIYEIVGKYTQSDGLPYKTILFDGAWGIGKSYAINEALNEKDNVCMISMFGLKDASQIYHEVLFQFALQNNAAGRFVERSKNILEGLAVVSDKADKAKDILQSVVKEREIFQLLSKEFEEPHIIVIDDLERISNDINLEEVLGIVEELRKCNYVKIILVAFLEELNKNKENKEIFNKYNEKVIDRIYHITERPQKVNWGNLNIPSDFISDFLKIHDVKNLRTLQKAQNFYDDVKLYFAHISNESFLKEIRLICFAVVVESIDNLYYRKPDELEQDSTKKILANVYNELPNRINRYLNEIKSSKSLVSMIQQYYENEILLDKESIDAEYSVFKEYGEIPNFYKSDDDIKAVLPKLRDSMNSAKNITELNKFADEFVFWSDILKIDNSNVLKEYQAKLVKMIEEMINQGNDKLLSYGATMFHLSSKKIAELYEQIADDMRKGFIDACIDYLHNKTTGEEAYNLSYKVREYFNSSFYREYISENIEKLYGSKSFPIGRIDEMQYHTCYNIMYVLYQKDSEKFLAYCDELSNTCDEMSKHRMDTLVRELVKGY